MLRFNDIADRILEYNPGCDLQLLQRAYVFSAKVHEGQERLSGEPYLVHPLEVAGILVEMRMDEVTVAAGLLHDTIEDTLTTPDELRRLFGEPVAFLVEGLTKIAKIEFTSLRERQAENFRKMLIAMSRDIRILMIKLADRLHNMRTLRYMPDESRHRVAQETLDIYVPLAHRLGIYWMKQRARGARLPHAQARGRRGAGAPPSREEPGAGRVHRRGDRDPLQAARGGGARGGRDGAPEGPGVDPPEDGDPGPHARRDLRRDRLPHHPRRRPGARLRGARDRPLDLAPGPRALQGLRRAAQAERLPVAAHHRDRPLRRADGDPDPDAGDAPERRVRDRRPLEVQGGPAGSARRRRTRTSSPGCASSSSGTRSSPIPTSSSTW